MRLQTLLLSTLLLLATVAPAVCADETRRPNILFILTDDQGWPTLGSYGNKLVPTPNLDRLAAQGARFTDAYAMPQCTPTRATLLTGQSTARNGMWHVIPWYGYPWAWMEELPYVTNLSRQAFTLPKGLQAAGYATGTAGKWHLTANEDGQYTFLRQKGAPHYGFDSSAEPADSSYPSYGDKGVGWLTDQAIGFIRGHQERPWFFYLAHHTLHDKVVAPEEIVAKYRERGAPETGLGNATYLAAIEVLDSGVGRLLAALDDLHLIDRTIVVFMADNGGVRDTFRPDAMERTAAGAPRLIIDRSQFPNDPLRAGKGAPYEGGIRVPCLIRWPGVVKPGTVISTPIQPADWLPTFFEVTGAHAPDRYPLDGTSLVPLLRGGALPERELYWHLPLYDIRWGLTPCAIFRDGDWKLIEYFGDYYDTERVYHQGRRLELYNLREDAGETHDLAASDPARREALERKLHTWLSKMPHGQIPLQNPGYDAQRAFDELTLTKEFHATPR